MALQETGDVMKRLQGDLVMAKRYGELHAREPLTLSLASKLIRSERFVTQESLDRIKKRVESLQGKLLTLGDITAAKQKGIYYERYGAERQRRGLKVRASTDIPNPQQRPLLQEKGAVLMQLFVDVTDKQQKQRRVFTCFENGTFTFLVLFGNRFLLKDSHAFNGNEYTSSSDENPKPLTEMTDDEAILIYSSVETAHLLVSPSSESR